LFDPPLILRRGMLRPFGDTVWRRKVTAVMQRFRRAFPEIVYDIAWKADAPNGVAWRQISQPHVRLYGGLLRHRAIGLEAVALLFAHETGHHKGGPPRNRTYTWMTCERQADFWAARFGVAAAWEGDTAESQRQIVEGARQVLAFETAMIQLRNQQCENNHLRETEDYPTPKERFRIFMTGLDARHCA
jgi:hypothetical protein